MKRLKSDNKMLGYALMQSYSNISCFSTTRHGGCSEGNYASFNCNSYCGDEPVNVARNCELLSASLSQRPIELVIPHQTHEANVLAIDPIYIGTREVERKQMLEGIDALITDIPGYCLCVSTADCIPLLLYDTVHQAVAAIHAGWRGTVNRIVEHTLSVMADCYGSEGKDIVACIGPGISRDAFEVGDEVYNAFCEAGFEMNPIALKNQHTGKWHLDLWEANRLQLLARGIDAEKIEVAGICTYKNNEDFFSARRQGIRSGRILSGIMLHK